MELPASAVRSPITGRGSWFASVCLRWVGFVRLVHTQEAPSPTELPEPHRALYLIRLSAVEGPLSGLR